MHDNTLNRLQHTHHFANLNQQNQRRLKIGLVLTVFTMLLEISTGTLSGSMALLVDGWHMGIHAAVLLIALLAQRYSECRTQDASFAFGAGKVSVLGGFASAVALGVVALMLLLTSAGHLLAPLSIHFDEAIAVASFGLLINLIIAFLLKNHSPLHLDDIGSTRHREDDEDDFEPTSGHHPKVASLFILSSTLPSVLAVIALVVGKYYGWNSFDPAIGMVGALIIGRWAYVFSQETKPILLDTSIAVRYKAAIQEAIEADADNRIADLHIWRVSPGHFAVILSVVSHQPKEPEYYKALLSSFNLHGGRHYLAHITVEVHRCDDEACLQPTTTIFAKPPLIQLKLR